MGITFSQKPEMFGTFHICALFGCVIFNLFVYRYFKDKEEAIQLKCIHYCGVFMIIMEIIKQVYCYHYVFSDSINLWFFPWQLCSTAMYCAFVITYVRRNIQNTLLLYLSTYCLLGAIMALLVPPDMLREQIYLTCYSFLYHYLMIGIAILSILILKTREKTGFSKATILFLIMASIAEIINIVSHQILKDIHIEPNMFYITPYYPTTQPVLSIIANRFGIFTEIVLYLGLIILMSSLIYRLIIKKL